MALDGKLLARARAKLEETHLKNLAEQEDRLRRIYVAIPEIQSIDSQMRAQMTSVVKLTASRAPDLKERLEEIKNENLTLQSLRLELLKAHGYAEDWLEPIYSCEKCRDTGYVDGEVCSCLTELYNKEVTAELGVLLQTGDECFENFDLSLYGDKQYAMKLVYDTCREYANSFSGSSMNLLFEGGTGLGKTYLSACIARVVAEKGFSVCYDTAAAALEAFEQRKFARSAEIAAAADSKVSNMLDCDLMILDDLGTEMTTSVSVSALYTLINTRLVNGKKTIISTNLTAAELAKKYTPQICSRIEGEFTCLPFSGRDIRLVLKEI